MSINKSNIGLVFGGRSSEHEISIKSAKNIINALHHSENKRQFNVIPIYIDKSGFWWDFESSKSILFEYRKSVLNKSSGKENLNKLINLPILSEKIDIWMVMGAFFIMSSTLLSFNREGSS